MPHPSDMIPLPDAKGPRLRPFHRQIEDIQFLRLLSSNEQYSDDVPHSRVFHIQIADQSYALKVVSIAQPRQQQDKISIAYVSKV